MNRDKIIAILKEQEYPEFMIESTTVKIEAFAPKVASVFSIWIENRLAPQIEIEGYSYNSLIEKFKMKPVGAFITLDWLIREPEVAISALEKGIK